MQPRHMQPANFKLYAAPQTRNQAGPAERRRVKGRDAQARLLLGQQERCAIYEQHEGMKGAVTTPDMCDLTLRAVVNNFKITRFPVDMGIGWLT